jgi:sigma-B regulation protein RsbU (phosphoserine phosphatase)
LPASDPPLGMDERRPATARRAWASGKDLLVLFTDGVSDARNRAGERLGEERVLDAHITTAPRRDDLTIVLLRT